MDIQKIGWNLINGINLCRNFIDSLVSAVEGAGLKITTRSVGQEWMGVYIQADKIHFCAIYYDDPSVLWHEIYKDKYSNAPLMSFDLDFIKKGFFDLDKKE